MRTYIVSLTEGDDSPIIFYRSEDIDCAKAYAKGMIDGLEFIADTAEVITVTVTDDEENIIYEDTINQ